MMSSQARPLDRTDLPGVARAIVGVILFALVVVALVPIWSLPTDLIRDVARLQSNRTPLTIDDAVRGTFVPAGPSVPLGFGQTTHWLRLTIDPAEDGQDVLVRLRPIALDRATLFLPDARGQWRTEETGELVQVEARSWPSLLRHTLVLRGLASPVTAYLKIESRSPATLFVTAYPVVTSIQIEVRTLAFHAFVFGLKIVSLLLILLTLPKQKSRANPIFLALEATYLAYLGLHLGYAQAIFHDLPPWVLDAASSGIVGLAVLVGAAFHRAFLIEFDPAPAARIAAGGPILLALMGTVALAVGLRFPGLALVAFAYLSLVPAIVAMLVTMRGDAPPGRRMVRTIYAFYLPVLVTNFATTLGIVRIDWFYRNGPELLSLTNSTLILALILTMNRALNTAWHEQRGRIRQQILAQRAETKVRRAQHFLTQLVAEETRGALGQLQGILSRRTVAAGPDAASRAMRALDDVIENCLQADEAETGIWRTQATPFDMSALVRDLVDTLLPDQAITLSTPDRAMLVSDAALAGVVLRHLLNNAATYGDPARPVTVRLARTQRGATTGIALDLTNAVPAGVTIDPTRIFEKFFRGAQASTTSGTGLGLFICREIAAALGGTIHATSAGGTVTFHLWLPDRT